MQFLLKKINTELHVNEETKTALVLKGSAAFTPPNIGGVSEGRGGFAPPNIGGVSEGRGGFAPPNIGGVSEGRGGFAPPNIGGVSEGRGGFGALRTPHALTERMHLATCSLIPKQLEK